MPLLLALLAGGCSDLFGPEVAGRLLEVDGSVLFLVREIHGFEFDQVGDPEVAIYMVTERTYPCRGYAIEAGIGVEGSLVTVDMAGIREPAVCFRATEPAEARGLLGIGPGTWTLRFVHGDRSAEHTVTIDEAAIEISGATEGLAVPEVTRFWRYPPSSFAVGCDRAGGYPEVCAELLDSVAATPGLEPLVFGEDGAIPYPVSYTDAQYSWQLSYFRYTDPEQWSAARTRATAVHARYSGLRFYLLDWLNHHVGSWP